MRNHGKQIKAMTLTELLVVMSVMVILLALAVPVAKKLAQSLGESTGTRSVIAAAMSNARAIAVSEQKYAGVRFQQDAAGKQYVVLIIHDPNATGLANGFRAVQGKKPMALPDNVGVISEKYSTDTDLGDPVKFYEAKSCSIVFSPAGKLIIHDVRFIDTLLIGGKTLFLDDGQNWSSVNRFRIYDIKKLNETSSIARWNGYLSGLETEFVNPYAGELVKKN